MLITQWANRWGVPQAAITELSALLGAATQPDHQTAAPGSEAAVQNAVRMEAARRGDRYWRNNVGCLVDERGVPVRYGLANESAKMNKIVKSSDLIGISSQGQFLALEVKRPDWTYRATDRERAQLAFITFVNSMGGRAAFISSVEDM